MPEKVKRAGETPTLFVYQDKGAASDFVRSLGCACTDVLRLSAAGHYFLAFFFAFFAMVISPAVPIIGRSELLDKADELCVAQRISERKRLVEKSVDISVS